jgi:hypothetical protein
MAYCDGRPHGLGAVGSIMSSHICNESGIGRRALGVQRFRLPTIHPLGPYIPLSIEKSV